MLANIWQHRKILTWFRQNTLLLSVYLWVAIFIAQPHKEERFMYVIYPLICYNGAIGIESALSILDQLFSKMRLPYFSWSIVTIIRWGIFLVYAVICLARVLAQLRAYSAPMQLGYNVDIPSTICFGKEWYRFPSSFFIPEGSTPQFIQSSFRGLLPGLFASSDGNGWRSGTWQIPSGMNDLNMEEPSHYVIPGLRRISHHRSRLRLATTWSIRTSLLDSKMKVRRTHWNLDTVSFPDIG